MPRQISPAQRQYRPARAEQAFRQRLAAALAVVSGQTVPVAGVARQDVIDVAQRVGAQLGHGGPVLAIACATVLPTICSTPM